MSRFQSTTITRIESSGVIAFTLSLYYELDNSLNKTDKLHIYIKIVKQNLNVSVYIITHR